MKKRNYLISLFALLFAASITTACAKEDDATKSVQTTSGISSSISANDNSSEIKFQFKVVIDKDETTLDITTSKKNLAEALLEKGLISGEESESGLMADTVNGVTLDFNKDKAYWGFYIDGEYATAGVSDTEIEADKVYEFRKESA